MMFADNWVIASSSFDRRESIVSKKNDLPPGTEKSIIIFPRVHAKIFSLSDELCV